MNPFQSLEKCQQCSHSNSVAKFAIVSLAVAFVAFASSFHNDDETSEVKVKHRKARVVTVEVVKSASSVPKSVPIEIEKVGDK